MRTYPDGWKVRNLGEVATLQRGFDLPVKKRTSGEYPIFAANGPVGFHSEAKVNGPEVVTGRSGTLGKVHFVDEDYWPLNTSLWVKDFHNNHPRWIFWLLQWMKLEKHTRGTGVPTLNRNLIHVVPVPVPPIEEQRRIAEILDKADAIRRKRKEALRLTESLLRSAFLDMFGDPIKNPKNWDVTPLINLIDIDRPITYGILKPGPDIPGGIPYIRVLDMKNGSVDASNVRKTTPKIAQKYKRSTLKSGDLLLSIRGHVGRLSITPEELDGANITQDTARLSVGESIITEYLFSLLETPQMQQWMTLRTKGVGVKGINLADVKEIPTPVPPLELQQEFADIFRFCRSYCSDVQSESWWTDITVPMLEHLRLELRDLVQFIDRKQQKVVYTDFKDQVGKVSEQAVPYRQTGFSP